MLEYLHFHVDHAQLLKSLHDALFDDHHVKLALHVLVFVVLQLVHGLLNLLFSLILGNLVLSVLAHGNFLCLQFPEQLLRLFDFLDGRVFTVLNNLHLVLVLQIFEQLALVLLEHAIVIQHTQILEIENVRHLDALVSLVHDPKQQERHVVRRHQELEVVRLNLANLLIGREQRLALHFSDQGPELFQRLQIVLFGVVHEVVVADAGLLELMESISEIF